MSKKDWLVLAVLLTAAALTLAGLWLIYSPLALLAAGLGLFAGLYRFMVTEPIDRGPQR